MASGEQKDGANVYNEAGTGGADKKHNVSDENQEPLEADKKDKKKKKK
jgi:hypothetical protein